MAGRARVGRETGRGRGIGMLGHQLEVLVEDIGGAGRTPRVVVAAEEALEDEEIVTGIGTGIGICVTGIVIGTGTEISTDVSHLRADMTSPLPVVEMGGVHVVEVVGIAMIGARGPGQGQDPLLPVDVGATTDVSA